MSSQTVSTQSSSGIGFGGLLTIAFIVLKLTGYIDWSWWLVLLPLWGPALLAFVIFAIVAAVVVLKR